MWVGLSPFYRQGNWGNTVNKQSQGSNLGLVARKPSHLSEGQLPTHSFQQPRPGAHSAAGSGNPQLWPLLAVPAHHWGPRSPARLPGDSRRHHHIKHMNAGPEQCSNPIPLASSPHKQMKTERDVSPHSGWVTWMRWHMYSRMPGTQ